MKRTPVHLRMTGGLLIGCMHSAHIVWADVLLDQPQDSRYAVISYESPGYDFKGGDDFRTQDTVIIESVTFWMVATWPNEPFDWSFNAHRTGTDSTFGWPKPWYDPFYESESPDSVIDLGEWKGELVWYDDPLVHLFEITFSDVNLTLEPGRYWLSPVGWTFDHFDVSPFWATSLPAKEIDGAARWKAEPLGWGLMNDEIFGPSDFAMRIEGTVIYPIEMLDLQVEHGIVLGGGFDSILESDDDDLRIASVPINKTQQTSTIIEGKSPLTKDIASIFISVETAGNVDGVETTIALRDVQSGEWVEVDSFDQPLDDTVMEFDVVDDPARFIDSDSGAIAVRIHSQHADASHTMNIDHIYIEAFPSVD